MERQIRVLIIHRNRLFREGLAFVLEQEQPITVVGAVAEASAVWEELERLHPDVILVDLCLPERQGLGEAHQIRAVFPDVKILMLGLTQTESDILACIEAGAVGCLPQEASREDLVTHIRAVTAGETLWSAKVADVLTSRIAEFTRARELRRVLDLPNITRRELEIIALIEARLSNKEIAVRLGIEVSTVKNHIHNILDKLQLDDRKEAVRYAREKGLLPTYPAQRSIPNRGRILAS